MKFLAQMRSGVACRLPTAPFCNGLSLLAQAYLQKDRREDRRREWGVRATRPGPRAGLSCRLGRANQEPPLLPILATGLRSEREKDGDHELEKYCHVRIVPLIATYLGNTLPDVHCRRTVISQTRHQPVISPFFGKGDDRCMSRHRQPLGFLPVFSESCLMSKPTLGTLPTAKSSRVSPMKLQTMMSRPFQAFLPSVTGMVF